MRLHSTVYSYDQCILSLIMTEFGIKQVFYVYRKQLVIFDEVSVNRMAYLHLVYAIFLLKLILLREFPENNLSFYFRSFLVLFSLILS